MTLTIPRAFLFYLFFFLSATAQSADEDLKSFIFSGFYGHENDLTLEQASISKPSGLLRLTNQSKNAIGHAFYDKPLQMIDPSSSSFNTNASSFSTTFVFAIVPSKSDDGGFGLAFTLSPSKSFPGAQADQYLGIFNSSNDGDPSNHIFAVEFDTKNGFENKAGSRGNHVGININGMVSKVKAMAAYDFRGNLVDLELEDGNPIQSWIDYDGANLIVNVTIVPVGKEKPSIPLISYPINLTSIVKESMYVGFSASTGEKSSSHYILGWSFSMSGLAPALNLSQLPIPPNLSQLSIPPTKEKNSSSSLHPTIIALSSVIAVLILIRLCLTVYKRMEQVESLEDWELECSHRLDYGDLYTATKGFKDSEIIGVGGSGAVYKAVMPMNGNEVAIKKITHNSIQGIKESAVQMESLGGLRHKNLVNLQGWCRRKNDLFLVYDYIPSGNLETLLHNPRENIVLSWEERFKIIKGIASGLLYLHEENEQVVIHRDIKPSNVLIDSETNARLGDFGLVRLSDHVTISHTANVVGTIGYIAPELARTGKASTSSDVFAYGILLLEVATGRRPIDTGHFILVDWVLECQQMGRILDAADPKLNSRFIVEQMELVLGLGLSCSDQQPENRLTIKQITRYLDGEDRIPTVNDWGSTDTRRLTELKSRLSVGISTDITTSYQSSYINGMSSSSIYAGR
ncbi:hypothetical protein K2173_008424 [Erythroxylum novogranatense]|uniref:non-specific serine/threonine protein kinase n=1 Tax=Erythroxylum novogranatense TaxID=1862640 RepID=A0AAV8U8T8_9ROSI|nr:hypothetical protein K2173_008424 [Erythroxylum novogranatense]